MSSDRKKEDNRPAYVAPQVIRLHDISTGIGACGPGGSPASGRCEPVGNGPGIISCVTGNGAKGSCYPNGNGVKN